MHGAALAHGTVTPFLQKIPAGGNAMSLATVVFLVLGAVCLLASGVLMYKMIPRRGRPPFVLMRTESGETAVALSQFILMIAGLAFFAKAIL
jgi:hypothetical protein